MRYLFPTGKGYQRKWLGQDVLSGVVIAQLTHHVQRAKEILVGVLLHAHDHLGQHFSHAVPLFGRILGNDGLVHLGAFGRVIHII